MKSDIRWIQRLSNYRKALDNLREAINISEKRELNKLEKQGFIQAFEYTYELAWLTIKDFYQSKGEVNIQGSKDAFRMAFERGLVEKGAYLLEAVKSRQLTSHTYNEDTADEIYVAIKNKYAAAFIEISQNLEIEKEKEV